MDMPELRLNVITRDWVIIATERARRPNEFIVQRSQVTLPEFDVACPFCPGNEKHILGESYSLRDSKGWKVRVVPNKFPALSAEGERMRSGSGIFRSMSGVGFHEVIIEHRRHDTNIALMSIEDVADVLKVYRQRISEISKDPRIEAVIVFKNHGESAGASLAHPHSQLAATPVVPFQFRARIEEAVRHFDDTGECIFCRTLRDELEAQTRIVLETKYFVAFHPFASLSPFHTWIFPQHHLSSFHEIPDPELEDFAHALKSVLAKLYFGLNNPDYNYSIRSIPTRDRNTDYYHWYLTIIPRISKTAGFEYGSGMFINTSLPEESAEFLRKVKEPA
jgi:UDPglucose--hexose-1-phosphate uridylyltransferase